MRPLGNSNVGEINGLGTFALQTFAAQFLLQCDVPLQWALVKQISVRLEERGEFANRILGIKYVGLVRHSLCNLGIRSFSIEQLEEHPLWRLQPDEVVGSRQLGEDRRLAVFDLLLCNHPRI